jgi:hypothetical protein
LIGSGLVPLAVAGASVRSSAVRLVGRPLSAWPPYGVAGGGPFGLFDGTCRACGVDCFGGEVGVCFPVVASFVDPGCYCDLLGSWHCNMSNLFFVRIVKSEAFYRLHVFAFSSLFVLGGVLFLVCAFLVAL